VSRELLQDSRIAQTIRKQVVRKSLDLLDELAKDKAEDYAAFWKLFGAVLKEGLHYEPENKTRLAALLRYGSNKLADGEFTSLADYKTRMQEGQPAIYYLTGESRRALEGSPFLETLAKRGYEVLFMTDAVDEWAIEALREFDGTPLVSAVSADLKIEQTDAEKAAQEEKSGALSGLLGAFKTILDDKVSEVRVSNRLTDSPVCLVVPTGGLSAYMERLLKAHERNVPDTKRILEVNPDHGLVRSLRALHEKDPGSAQLVDFVEVLYDQALITEGSPVADPQRFARRMTKLLESAAS
jgi:molecular chaperone HtpG